MCPSSGGLGFHLPVASWPCNHVAQRVARAVGNEDHVVLGDWLGIAQKDLDVEDAAHCGDGRVASPAVREGDAARRGPRGGDREDESADLDGRGRLAQRLVSGGGRSRGCRCGMKSRWSSCVRSKSSSCRCPPMRLARLQPAYCRKRPIGLARTRRSRPRLLRASLRRSEFGAFLRSLACCFGYALPHTRYNPPHPGSGIPEYFQLSPSETGDSWLKPG